MSTTEMTSTSGSTTALAGMTPEEVAKFAGRTTFQGARQDTDSRHCCPSTGKMPPPGYGILANIFCPEAIKAAVYKPDGLNFTLERIRAGFIGQWGVEQAFYENVKLDAEQQLRPMEEEMRRLIELQKDTPQTKLIDGPVLPRGVALAGWLCLALSVVVMSVLALVNAASYFVAELQSYPRAILMCSPLLFVSWGCHDAMSRLGKGGRCCMNVVLALIGTLAATVFIYTIAVEACPPSACEIVSGSSAGIKTGLATWRLASQVALELVIGTALTNRLMASLMTSAKMVPNADYKLLTDRLLEIHLSMTPVREKLTKAQGELSEMARSLQFWLAQATIIFDCQFEHERRLAECRESLDQWPR